MLETIRARLTLWYVSALAVALFIGSVSIYVLLGQSLNSRVDEGLRALIAIAVTSLGNDLAEGQDINDAARSTARELASKDQMVAIFSPDGTLLADAGREPDLPLALPAAGVALGGEPLIYTVSETDERDDRHRIAVQQIELEPSGVRYIVMTSNSLDAIDNDLQSLRGVLLIVGPLMVGVAAVGGWLLARRSLEPVMQMADRARRMSGEQVIGRLPVANPRDELGRLAETFNELLDRLGASLNQQRQFMADASHELRTPVTTARTAASVALQQPHREEHDYRETLQIVEQQAARLSRIVEEMFLLARADAGQTPLHKSRMYLDEVLMEVARAARVLSHPHHITIEISGDTSAAMIGDEDLIRRLFVNLLDNAVRHSTEHSAVRVELRRAGSHYEATVVDQGSGVPAHAHAAIFERFYRGEATRARHPGSDSGAGLGLALARWIARAHGGDVVLADSSPSGSRFVVTLEIGAQAELV